MSKKYSQCEAEAVLPLPPSALLHYAKDGFYKPAGAFSDNTDIPEDRDLIVLGSRENAEQVKQLKRSKKVKKALIAYLTLPAAVPNIGVGWLLLALCLMSVALDVLSPVLPGLIAVEIAGTTVPSRFLSAMLNAHTIFPRLSSGKYKIEQPSVLTGNSAVITPMDLLGGTADSIWGKIKLWLPVINRPVAVIASLKETLQRDILNKSPYALPLFLGSKCPIKNATVIKLKAADVNQYDNEILAEADNISDFIHAILAVFSDWVHRKKAHRRKIVDAVDSFVPVARNGRFCRDLRADPQVMVRVTALAVLKVFLGFCCDEEWLTEKTSEDYLAAAWMAILPESCPTPPAGNQIVSTAVAWDKQETFWEFLQQHLGDGSKVLQNRKGNADTIALVNNIADERYLILPRKAVCDTYYDYISASGGTLPEGNFATILQGTMVNTWGISLRHEGNDLGYRYLFYTSGCIPVNIRHGKINCLTIPWTQTPEEIRLLLQPDQANQNGGETHAR